MSLVMTLQYILKIKDILPVLYGNIPLAIYFTYGNKYVSTLLSQFIPPFPAPVDFKLSDLVGGLGTQTYCRGLQCTIVLAFSPNNGISY